VSPQRKDTDGSTQPPADESTDTDPGAGPISDLLRTLPGAEAIGSGITRIPHWDNDDQEDQETEPSPNATRHMWGH
jgi:hypothetical protein